MADGRDAERRIDLQDRAFLREVRWREDERAPRHMRVAWLVAVAVHLVFVWLLRDAMRVREVPPPVREVESVLEISFLEPSPLPPAVREPPRVLAEANTPVVVGAAIAATAAPKVETPVAAVAAHTRAVAPSVPVARLGDKPMQAVFIPAGPESSQLKLFDHNGGLKLSQEVVDASSAKPQRQFEAQLPDMPAFMTRKPPVRYRPTLFEPLWKPRDENIVAEWLRNQTRERTFRTPWGTRIECAWLLNIGGCAFGIPPTPLANAPRGPGEVYEEVVKPVDPEAGW
jgi:hypothetical protein